MKGSLLQQKELGLKSGELHKLWCRNYMSLCRVIEQFHISSIHLIPSLP